MDTILEARADKGWERVPDHAPQFVKTFVTEFRTAQLANRSMNPNYLASYNAGAEVRETRSLLLDHATGRAKGFARRLFPTRTRSLEDIFAEQNGHEFRRTPVRKPKLTVEQLSKRYGVSVEKIETTRNRLKAEKLGVQMVYDSITDEDVRNMRREMFPWEFKD